MTAAYGHRYPSVCPAREARPAALAGAVTGVRDGRGNFRRRVWIKATQAAGIPGTHFHDLRHTGNNLTAQAGANLRELMERMSHSSTRAALIYLHATTERQRKLADSLGTFIGQNERPTRTHLARMWHAATRTVPT